MLTNVLDPLLCRWRVTLGLCRVTRISLSFEGLVLALQCLIRRITLAQDGEDLEGLREPLRRNKAVREDAVGFKLVWLYLQGNVGIGKCLLILHQALANTRSLEQKLIVN